MKVRPILIAAAALLLATLAQAPPAEAGHLDWSFGAGFHVGGLHFRVGFSPPGFGGPPGPFFLTTSRLHYPSYGCTDACFRRGGGFYHHASCPLLGFHLGHGGYGPDYYVVNFSPYRSYGRSYRPYPNRAYRYYAPDRYRQRFRSERYRHYRGRHHPGDRYRDQRYQGRPGRHYDNRGDGDRGRQYRSDRRRGGRDVERDRGGRRGAQRTRPPG